MKKPALLLICLCPDPAGRLARRRPASPDKRPGESGNKRPACLSLIAALLLCCLLTACGRGVPEDAASAGEDKLLVGAVVDAPVVNLRESPSLRARIIDTARRGEMFRIISLSEDSQWYEVFYHGESAYINAAFIYSSAWEDGAELTLGTVANTDDPVNVRRLPALEGEIILEAQKNERFVVMVPEAQGGWYQLLYKGEPAYVSAEFMELSATTINQALYK